MKKNYSSPELEVTLLAADDILTNSTEIENEVLIPGDSLWS